MFHCTLLTDFFVKKNIMDNELHSNILRLKEKIDQLAARQLCPGAEIDELRRIAGSIEAGINKNNPAGESSTIEYALRESEEKYQTLFNTMNQGVVYQDYEGKIISANPSAQQILGLTLDQMRGLTSRDPRWKAMREDGSDFPGNQHPAMVALRTGKKVRNVKMAVFNPEQNKTVWINIHATPLFSEEKPEPCQVYTIFEDITRRQEDRQKIKESLQYMNQAISAGKLAWWRWDVPTGKVICHPYKAEMIGYKPDEIPTDVYEFTKMIHPDEYPAAMQAMRDHLGGKKPDYTVEYRIKTKTGGWKWLLDKGEITERSPDGKPLKVTGVVFDISERKKIEQMTKAQEKKFRSLFNFFTHALYIHNFEGKFYEVNQRACRFFGLSRGEFLKKTVFDIFSSKTQAETERLMAKVTRDKEIVFETTHKSKFGHEIPVEINAKLIDYEGQKAILAITRDISERKIQEQVLQENMLFFEQQNQELNQAYEKLKVQEEKYRLLADNSADVIWQMDLRLRFTYVSPSIENLTGYTVGEWQGSRLSRFCSFSEFVRIAKIALKAIKNAKNFEAITFEAFLKHKKGQEIPVEISGKLLKDKNGKAVALQGITRNISQRKKNEQILLEKNRRILLQNEEYLAVTEELEDNMQRIRKMNTQLLREKMRAEENQEKFQTIFSQAAIGLCMVSPQGELVKGNERFCEIVGYTPTELAQMNVMDLVHPDDQGKEKAMIAKVQEGEIDSYEITKRYLHKKGHMIWGNLYSKALRDKAGKVKYAIGALEDITEKRRAEQKIRESKAKLDTIFKTTPIGIGIVVNRTFESVNAAFCKMLGVGEKELIGKSTRLIYPTEKEFLRVGEVLYPKAQKAGYATMQAKLLTRRGEILDILLSIAPIDPKDWNAGIVFSAMDFTELKKAQTRLAESEAKYRSMFSNNYSVMLLIEPETGKIVDANAAAARFYGYPKQVLKTMNIRQINILPDKSINSAIEKVTNNQQNYFEFKHRLANGKTKNVEVYSGNVWVNEKRLLYSVIHDITDKVNAEKELENYKTHLEKMVALRTEELAAANEALSGVNQELKATYQTLEENKNFLDAVFENIPLGLHIFDPNGNSRRMNQAQIQNLSLGKNTANFSQNNIFKDPVAIKNRSITLFEKARQGQTSLVKIAKSPLNKLDLTPHNKKIYSQRVFPIFSRKKELSALIAIVDDITQKAEAQEQFRRAKKIVESSSNVLFRWKNAQGWPIEYVSENIAHFGYKPEKLLREKQNYLEIVSENDRERLRDDVQHAIETNADWINLEYQIKTPTGKLIWVEEQSKMIKNKQGKVKYFEGVVSDIDDRKRADIALRQSEDKFRSFIEQSPMGFMLTDENGNIAEWNSGMHQITSLAAEDCIGIESWTILYEIFYQSLRNENLDNNFIEEMRQFFQTGQAPLLNRLIEGMFIQPNHNKRYVQGILFSISTNKGYMLGLVLEDITEKKQAEIKIKKALAREKELNELKTSFVSMTSHQFKTPLTTILSSAELLTMYLARLEHPKKDAIDKHCQRISQEVSHMNNMITDFLVLGKVETGKTPFNPRQFDFVELAKNTIANHFANQQQPIIFESEKEIHCYTGDKALIEHILVNLLSNALKYSNAPPRLSLAFTKEKTIVKVRDYGIGIPTRDQKHLFQSFFRASNVQNTKGTGLGLSIVKRFVEMHKGKIAFWSKPGEGTEFTIEL